MKSELKEQIVKLYNDIVNEWDVKMAESSVNVNAIIKQSICEFLSVCKKPAIWCFGEHTNMLMTDYIFELKNVKTIIDNNIDRDNCGFTFIKPDSINDYNIDGVIISSFKYKDDIKEVLQRDYKNIKYLDLYECLKDKGEECTCEYYLKDHPYKYYERISEYKNLLNNSNDDAERKKTLTELIKIFIYIKDFPSAIEYIKKLMFLDDDSVYEKRLQNAIDLYGLQLQAVGHISKKNVLMLCIDGLRRRDILNGLMPKLSEYIKNNMVFYENAYSVSTSTYESLIPTYSENYDMKTEYYNTNVVEKGKCRFIEEAKRQNRNIYFYTDSVQYIDDSVINVTQKSQTVSEKIWDFVLDAIPEENGLFYIHILYESHFSYPSPFVEGDIVAKGTNILFDYLSADKKLHADYYSQHISSLRYVDSFLSPIINGLNINFVLYADHGNLVLPKTMEISNIKNTSYSFGEEMTAIPLAIKMDGMHPGKSKELISLSEINNIVISLLNQDIYKYDNREYIKIQRSEIYNQDFRYLYKCMNFEKGIKAFEMFIFRSGYKLVIYSDGEKELYNTNDNLIDDEVLLRELETKIREKVTLVLLM